MSGGEPGEWLTGPVGADPACTTTMAGQQGDMAREDDGSWQRGRDGEGDSGLEKVRRRKCKQEGGGGRKINVDKEEVEEERKSLE